jgi:methionyl-tRNA formyltransferase
VQKRAEALGIAVRTPVTLRDPDEQARFAALEADAAVVAAYGLILPRPILAAPRLGCFNIHASLLPRWRGAAPIQRAILAGDAVTGVTIMDMEAGLDTGPMRATVETRCAGKDTGFLTEELAALGAKLMVKVLADLDAFPPVPQPDEGVTYAKKVEKSEARIDFANDAKFIWRQVDAFAPNPGGFFEVGGERIKVLKADWEEGSGEPGQVLDDRLLIACGKDAIRPYRVQRAGRAEVGVDDFLRGFPLEVGTRLS